MVHVDCFLEINKAIAKGVVIVSVTSAAHILLTMIKNLASKVQSNAAETAKLK